MADNLSMALAELLRKADAEPDVDTLREGVRVMTQALMELEVAQHLGAERVRHVGAQTIPFAERRGSEYFTSGSTAYPRAKARRDRSMPSKRGTPEDVYDVAPQDPHDKVKVGLLEPQSPAVHKPTPRYHVCSEDPRDTRFRRTTSEAFHSGERPPSSGSTGRTGHLTRAVTSIGLRRRDRLSGASPRATEPS